MRRTSCCYALGWAHREFVAFCCRVTIASDLRLMPNAAAISASVIPVISMTFRFEWSPETSCNFDGDVRSLLDSHLTISRLAFPFTGGAATWIVSAPSGSQSSLVSGLSGFTCNVNLTPLGVDHFSPVIIPIVPSMNGSLSIKGIEMAFRVSTNSTFAIPQL
jgi:hypothetical protein